MHVIVPYELSTCLIELQSEDCKTITNIGSMYGVVAVNPNLYSENDQPSPIHYGVAKAACHHLTKELAIRFSENNVRVNCVAFGGVEGRVNKDFKKRYAKFSSVVKWKNKVDIKKIYEELEIIRNPTYYGAYLAGGVLKLNKKDYDLIISKSKK